MPVAVLDEDCLSIFVKKYMKEKSHFYANCVWKEQVGVISRWLSELSTVLPFEKITYTT